jgi:hypothetical protein
VKGIIPPDRGFQLPASGFQHLMAHPQLGSAFDLIAEGWELEGWKLSSNSHVTGVVKPR